MLSEVLLYLNIFLHNNSYLTQFQAEEEILNSDEIDARLMHHDRGVDHALQRAKIWAKYAKDVLNYVEKRTSMQMDLSKNLTKLVQTCRPQLQEEIFLPFQSIYCLALDQDLESCALMQASCGLLQGCKVNLPISYPCQQTHS